VQGRQRSDRDRKSLPRELDTLSVSRTAIRECPDPGRAEASYATWVTQHDTFGLGKDVVISTGKENVALLALVNGKFVTLRVPYPQSFYAKGMDVRGHDDARAN